MKFQRFLPSQATVIKFGIASGIGSVAFQGLDDKDRRKVWRTAQASFRIAHLLGTVGVMVADYGYNIARHRLDSSEYMRLELELRKLQLDEGQLGARLLILGYKSDSPEALELHDKIGAIKEKIADVSIKMAAELEKSDHLLSPIHERNAIRMRNMCAHNKGIYIKLGQHLSMLDYIVPKEYQTVLSSLLANNPISSKESVRNIMKEDFGKYPEELFDSFDYTPIASASLAQVHVGYKNNKKYAIKIQHEGLAEGSESDRAVVTYLVDTIPRLFKEFNYTWLTKEMNINLPLELDFHNEVQNLQKCRQNLHKFIEKGDLVLPTVNEALSSRRVITMSFEEGVYVSKLGEIAALGLSKEEISELISRVFCEQIFRAGFVHSDPHAANMLVRPHPHPRRAGQPQLVLLDHGLYRQLSDDFRLNYCRLWQAMILGRQKDIETYCHYMNAGEAYPLLAAMLTYRTWDDIMSVNMDRMRARDSKTETLMLQAYAQKYFKDVVDLLTKLPSELLLIFKTNDCLRHIDKMLNTPVNSTAVVAEITADILFTEDYKALKHHDFSLSSWYHWGTLCYTYFNLKLRVTMLKLMSKVMAIGQSMKHFLFGWIGIGFANHSS